MNIAYVALGANLGDPAATVLAAFGALANLAETRIVHTSSLYRTAPVGIADQPDFINAVAALETTLAPEALYNELELQLPRLTLPHPRLHLRAFVLLPLAEIAPHLQLPRRGSIAAWLPAVANQGISKL